MSQTYELLVAEVDRVVGSPYPTQLKVGLPYTHTRHNIRSDSMFRINED
jgi:hypothetical protein